MAKGRPREFDTEKALDAALLLFWRHGYEGTSLAALTSAMRISTPSLYAAFGSKESLFRKAVDRYVERPASYLPNALKERTARRAVQKLFRGAINLVMHPRHPDGCLLVHGALAASPACASIREQLSIRRTRAEMAVRRRFDMAVAEHDLPAGTDTRQLARFIVTILWGLSVQAAGGAKRSQLEEVAELAMQCWPKAPGPRR